MTDIDLPCDEWVNLDLSTAVFLNDSGGDPTGEFSDGVIWGPGANYWFDFTLDPTKAYTVEVTFDPDSAHDGGARLVDLWSVRPGHEQDDYDPFTVAGLYSSGNTTSDDVGDVITVTIGPDIARTDDGGNLTGTPDWNDPTGGVVAGYNRLFIENTVDGAVSAVRVKQICAIDLPCDEWVNLDLSTATQLGDGDVVAFGQYNDGVIYTRNDPGGYPDFWFPFEVDPAKSYRIAVTYDPDSEHDADGREVQILCLRPGHEADDLTAAYAIGINAGGASVLYDTGLGSTSADAVQSFIIGPGRDRGNPLDPDLPGWDDPTLGVVAGYTRLWFETDYQGAVSQISIMKICTTFAPPLRQYPRNDGLGTSSARRVYPPPPTVQASNRRGPTAIL